MLLPNLTLREVANAIGAALPGDADPAMPISGAASIAEAGAGQITFYEHPKYLRALRATEATVVLVPPDFDETLSQIALRVKNPSAAFDSILEKFAPLAPSRNHGIHPSAVVHDTAEIDPTASIGAQAVIEAGVIIGARSVVGAQSFIGCDSQLGAECHVHPHAVLRERTILGARVVVHSSAVIGSDGFGFRLVEGGYRRLSHRGHVQLDDDVEVGAGTMIDRARFGRTWIQAGSKIDNLVHIAHNVIVGKHCLIVAQTGISGSAHLGSHVILAGQVGVVGHVEIGDHVTVTAKSGVSKNASANEHLMGTYGIPVKDARELVAHYHRLPKTVARLKKVEKELDELRKLVAQLAAASPKAA
ncbi:MAG TPA: UDP-3-O-(3-hydroxymyristoyl)glucosamine N-acyltransferase [Chthoniobacter sp.]|jgi:UDP-3-O-[3-hydroxymyristoyl] glucosamine N-acyltransferase